MNCQWCKNYRRRKGTPKCLVADGKGGRVISETEDANGCARFAPRKTCTTCEFRCPAEDRVSNMDADGACPKWRLRVLASWGGHRYIRRKNAPVNKKEEAL